MFADNLADGAVGAAKVADGSLGPAKWSGSVPAARVTLSAAQTISGAGVGTIAFDVESYDTANVHSAGDNTKLTAPITGIYEVSASIEWASNSAADQRSVALVGPSNLAIQNSVPLPSDPTNQAVSTSARLEAGDSVTVVVSHDTNSNLDIGSANSR